VHLGAAIAYKEKAKLTETTPDFWEAVQCFMSTSKMMPEDSEFQFFVRWNFAELLSLVPDFRASPQLENLGETALRSWSILVEHPYCNNPKKIEACSRVAGLFINLNEDYNEAKNYFVKGVELLPKAVLLHSSRMEQLRMLRKFHYLPSMTAAAMLKAGDTAASAI